MSEKKNSDARLKANAKYDAKTYRRVNLRLRLEDDADIIASMDKAQENGISNREWLNDLYYKAQQKG